MSENPSFLFVPPRQTVEIYLPDGRVICGPRCSPVGDFLKLVYADQAVQSAPAVGAIVNGELRELTYPISIESHVQPITMSDADGMRIYRRSLTFLLEAAFEDLFPRVVLTIDHSVSSGGYFCQIAGRSPLDRRELADLESHMQQLVASDLPLTRSQVPLSEAVTYFSARGHTDKVHLLSHRKKDYLTLYSLGKHRDYLHGYMVPTTGYLRWFALVPTGEGFTLRFPRRHRPTQLLPMPDYPKLLAAFRQYGDWLNRLEISNAGALNDSILDGRIREVILVSEALHEQQVADISDLITARLGDLRIVLIAGPSSSGKTTFSKRLTIQLLAHGISPYPLEIDNYFLDRDRTPRDESGEFDFESIHALNLSRLETDIRRLIAGESVQLPRYNFKTGLSGPGDVVHLQAGQIIIMEGIHGLNPDLMSAIPNEQTFRIYVSALTQLNLDRYNRISTTDTRLLRRIVRDARERGYSARDTIQRWESVRRGEKNYIFPFQENADVMFNSALVYELAVLKLMAEPLLRQVPYNTPEHVEAKRLLAFLEWFVSLDSSSIPDNSILREFVGGSNLSDFYLWNANADKKHSDRNHNR